MRRSRATALVALTVALALTPACSSGRGRAAEAGRGATSTTTVAPNPSTAGRERFDGSVDDFYVVPDPVPPGEPGDLIRVQHVGSSGGRTMVRVMYHSNDASGADRAVTGLISYPDGKPPAGGWPVISVAHSTTGIASRCAPSRSGEIWDLGLGEGLGFGTGVVAATDYVGMGPVGELHPFLSRPSEGNPVIDAVRAARNLPGTHAGRRWISIGYSQGGHGALSAHELAPDRAPELELVATVALAPGSMLDRVYGGIDPIVTSVLTMMSLWGSGSEHPELDRADYLTPEALKAGAVFEAGCLDEITDTMAPVAAKGAFIADPRTTEPARTLVLESDVGDVAVPGVPVFLAAGTKDDRVVIERARDLFARMCAAGQDTEFVVVDGADHGSIIPAVADRLDGFAHQVLDGKPTTNSCPDS